MKISRESLLKARQSAENQTVGTKPKSSDPNFPVYDYECGDYVTLYIPKNTPLIPSDTGYKPYRYVAHDYKGTSFGRFNCINGVSAPAETGFADGDECPGCAASRQAFEAYNLRKAAMTQAQGLTEATDDIKDSCGKYRLINTARAYVDFPVVVLYKQKVRPGVKVNPLPVQSASELLMQPCFFSCAEDSFVKNFLDKASAQNLDLEGCLITIDYSKVTDKKKSATLINYNVITNFCKGYPEMQKLSAAINYDITGNADAVAAPFTEEVAEEVITAREWLSKAEAKIKIDALLKADLDYIAHQEAIALAQPTSPVGIGTNAGGLNALESFNMGGISAPTQPNTAPVQPQYTAPTQPNTAPVQPQYTAPTQPNTVPVQPQYTAPTQPNTVQGNYPAPPAPPQM